MFVKKTLNYVHQDIICYNYFTKKDNILPKIAAKPIFEKSSRTSVAYNQIIFSMFTNHKKTDNNKSRQQEIIL